MLKQLLTYDELAKLIGVKKGTLYFWVFEKRIPHVKLGARVVRFDPDEVAQWMTARSLRAEVIHASR